VQADALLDVSGISYVDGRGATLVYNIACNFPALAVGTPLIKMSQAVGPFRTSINRLAARLVLPCARMIFARGKETEQYLRELGLENFARADDLAFNLNEHIPIPALDLGRYPEFDGEHLFVGISPSEVLRTYSEKRGIDLVSTLAQFLDELRERTGARVAIIAHSLLEPGKRSRNNDYHVCTDLYHALSDKEHATLVIDDLTPSELRAVIARCQCFIACRFHSMISALCVEVPTLVLAWSHKYREVMDSFGLQEFVIDAHDVSSEQLLEATIELLENRNRIRKSIKTSTPRIAASSRSQIEFIANILEEAPRNLKAGRTATRLYKRFYRDRFDQAFIGYASDPAVRDDAASGGLVSALLLHLLASGAINAALTCRAAVKDGKLDFRTETCTARDEILACRTSIYSDFNHARNVIRILEKSEGAFAIVALPCQWKMINSYLVKHPEQAGKVALKIGLWCGHATDRRLIDDFLEQKGVDLRNVKKLIYRSGHWRGETVLEHSDGRARHIPFKTGYGLLQNLYVDCKLRCYSCTDHFANGSDISFGDAWLGALKWKRIKHSMALTLTGRGHETMQNLQLSGGLVIHQVQPEIALQSQKRAVIWHTYGSSGRSRIGRLLGFSIPDRSGLEPRWNDYLSAFLILAAHRAYASPLRGLLLKLPWPLPYCYMLLQKTFLNF
jgi:coenzyme F420-reducing hydrogenase beta subunit/polysaccharide pyruvyl transferase WcaK-like protein